MTSTTDRMFFGQFAIILRYKYITVFYYKMYSYTFIVLFLLVVSLSADSPEPTNPSKNWPKNSINLEVVPYSFKPSML